MNVYLIVSDSKKLLEEEIINIISKNTNVVTYHYPENSITDILEEASYVSLFEEKKYLIIKNADFFGKNKLGEKDTELLQNYLENPYPMTTLIFTTYEELDNRKSVTKKIQEIGKVITKKAPKNYDLFLEIKKQLSIYKIEDNTIRYIIDSCLGNYDIIEQELEKLTLLFQKNDTIKLSEIKKIIVPTVNDNVFKFVDAVITKDSFLSFQLLKDFMIIKLDVLQLLNLLAREYRLIYFYKLLEKKYFNKIQMCKELKLKDWQIDKIRKESAIYHEDDLKDALVDLALVDKKIKSGEEDKMIAFESFLIKQFEY